MRHKEDDRSNNVDRIQYNIDRTIQNVRIANDMIDETGDDKTREALEAKNDRREEAVTGMRQEIKDEALDKEDGYK